MSLDPFVLLSLLNKMNHGSFVDEDENFILSYVLVFTMKTEKRFDFFLFKFTNFFCHYRKYFCPFKTS